MRRFLPDTFAPAYEAAHVDISTTKLLLNHTWPGSDVTDGCMGGDDEHTRKCVEQTAAFLLGKAKAMAHAGAVKAS